jgi:hypothetical protein
MLGSSGRAIVRTEALFVRRGAFARSAPRSAEESEVDGV